MDPEMVHSTSPPTLPPTAILGSSDSNDVNTSVDRTFLKSDLKPAKVIEEAGYVLFGWGLREYKISSVEMPVEEGYDCANCSDRYVAPNAVSTGTTRFGEPVDVGCNNHKVEEKDLSKSQQPHDILYISFDRTEMSENSTQILIAEDPWEHSTSAGLIPPKAMSGDSAFDDEEINVGCAQQIAINVPSKIIEGWTSLGKHKKPCNKMQAEQGYIWVDSIQCSDRRVCIPFGDGEVNVDSFQVIVHNQEAEVQQNVREALSSSIIPCCVFKVKNDSEGYLMYLGLAKHDELPAIVMTKNGHNEHMKWYKEMLKEQGYVSVDYFQLLDPHRFTAFGNRETKLDPFQLLLHNQDSEILQNNRIALSLLFISNFAIIVDRDADGFPIYLGRARHEGELLPAKVMAKNGRAYISFLSKEIEKSRFDVLVGQGYEWKKPIDHKIPHNAVWTAKAKSGKKIYYGRGAYKGIKMPGLVLEGERCLYIACGREVRLGSYELLCKQ